MTIQLINPADLPPQATYTQVVVAAGTTTVFIAGQEPEDVHGNSVAPGDLVGQAARAPRGHHERHPGKKPGIRQL